MPCNTVNFELGLCVSKRAWYQQKCRQQMLQWSLCVTKVAMTRAAKGRARNNLAWLSYVSSYIWLNNGDIIPSWLGMTCLPPWISQRKENLFFFFLLAFDMIRVVLSVPSTRNWCILTQHPAAYSSPSFPMGKFKLLKWCCFIFHGKPAHSAAQQPLSKIFQHGLSHPLC